MSKKPVDALTIAERKIQKEYQSTYRSILDAYKTRLAPFKTKSGYDFDKIRKEIRLDPHLNVEQRLFGTIDQLLEKLATNEDILIEDALRITFRENYDKLYFQIQKSYGYEFDIAVISDSRIDTLIHAAWSADGKPFSSRVWANKELAATHLKETITHAIATGESPTKTVRKFRDATSSSLYNSQRIIRTETNRVITESDQRLYSDLGFEEYEYNASFDNRTSEVCGDLDGQRFKFSELRIGVNAPPMHPNCRSTIEAVTKTDYKPPLKYARDSLNRPIKIPSDMTYAQYKRLNLEG